VAKKRAFVKYTKQGRLIPGSLIVTTVGSYPVDGLYTEVPTNICCDTDILCPINSSPKGWVRYTKSGQIVPGGLVVGKSHPKDGVWKEVIIDLCCKEPTYEIGQEHEGGIIFYLNPCKTHGLIRAKDSALVQKNWGSTSISVLNTSVAFGFGQQNTNLILAADPGSVNNAAHYCDSYTADGFSDWYLPSPGELNPMDSNNLLPPIPPSPPFTTGLWTSYQFSGSGPFHQANAYMYSVPHLGIVPKSKLQSHYVIPIRSF